MRCPDCGKTNTMVIETRMNDERTVIKRRRKCVDCLTRFNTLEKLDSVGLMVKKKSKHKEPYDSEKVLRGIKLALKKRPFDEQTAVKLAAQVEDEILKKGMRVVETKEIGVFVKKLLKRLDKVAYLRFASVYNDFEDVESFEKELKYLKNK